MNKPDFTIIDFFIPGIARKKLKGKIIWNHSSSITLEFENTVIKRFPFLPFEVIYAQTKRKQKFSLIGCFPNYNIDNYFVYSINEVHENEWIRNRPAKVYKRITSEITFLTTWYKSSFKTEHPPNDSEVFLKINVLNNIKASYKINQFLSLEINAFPGTNFKKNVITLTDKSNLVIYSSKSLTRNTLFENCSSFLNLFSLFVKSKPYIEYILVTKRNDEEQKIIMNFKKPQKETELLEVLIFHKEIEKIFEIILKKYFKSAKKYDEIVDRLRTIDHAEEEQTFLILCRCLEIYHNFFVPLKNDKELIKNLSKEFRENGIQTSEKNGWNQLLRYLHLYEISKEFNFFQTVKTSHYKFLDILKNTRNHYTHPHSLDKAYWSYDELKRINIELKIWVRTLLYISLDIPSDIIERVRNKEKNIYIFLNHETNPFSIFFKKS